MLHKNVTPQELFDMSYRAALEVNEPAGYLLETGPDAGQFVCTYRDNVNTDSPKNRCILGKNIADSDYTPSMEGVAGSSMFVTYYNECPEKGVLTLIDGIQNCHDSVAETFMPDNGENFNCLVMAGLRRLAEKEGLTTPTQ